MKISSASLAVGIALIVALICALPALATESGLLGIEIGATPQDVTRAYGPPAGIVFAGPGGGLILNTLRTQEEELMVQLGKLASTAPATPPDWAKYVLPSSLAADQQMWIYRMKSENGPISAGFIFRGYGTDAVVTDIVASSLKSSKKVRTEKGIRLGDRLAQVMLSYGYPPLIQPYPGALQTVTVPAQAPTATAKAAGVPNFSRPGAGSPMRGRGGRSMAGRPRLGALGRGTGPLPTLGAATATTTFVGSQVAMINQRPVTFTKNCVILYDGLALTLYNFQVVRIQVTQ